MGAGGEAGAAGFSDMEEFNVQWHGVYGYPAQLRSEEEEATTAEATIAVEAAAAARAGEAA